MEKRAITVLTLFLLSPAILGANIYREIQKSTNVCQEKDTVCKMSSGGFYGCCPATDGVCCADGDHCCPSGYKCDLSAKHCLKYTDQAMIAEDMLYVVPIEAEALHGVTKGLELTVPRIDYGMKAKPISANHGAKAVYCPGGAVCPVNTTCCMDLTGMYRSCYPTPLGNCCFDYHSCCPSGYVCNTIDRANNCIKAGGY